MRIASRAGRRVAVAAAVFGVAEALAAGGTALATGHTATSAANAQAMDMHVAASQSGYGFRTFNDNADPTFNQLLGINDDGLLCRAAALIIAISHRPLRRSRRSGQTPGQDARRDGGGGSGGSGGVQVEGSGPPYQDSMMCRAIDTGGGRASSRAWMAASSSSRLNQ